MARIRLLILDVDGVLTDGRLAYTAQGQQVKEFCVLDGSAIRRWQAAGGTVAIVSGLKAEAVEVRARHLGIACVVQGVCDKLAAYEVVCREAGVDDARTCYVGDDLPDIPPMTRCGYPIAPANAAAMVKRVAAYVTRRGGGDGAVAEAIERLMRRNGCRPAVRERREGTGESPDA